jgi:1,4-dihydroxy-2-naphthoate octaprenyltransferase
VALLHFIRLGRPHFLAGGVVFYALGTALAIDAGHALNVTAWLCGQIAVTCVQLMTHYANEYFDLAGDRANLTPTDWSGGSRVLVAGLLPPRVALFAGGALAVLAAGSAAALALLFPDRPLAAPLVVFALALAWSYSAPPLRLHSRGVGELATALLVTGCVPWLGFYLQAGELNAAALWLSAPLACLQVAMLLAIEFPDAAGDAAAGKRTLLVRIGARAGARLTVALLAAAFVLTALYPLGGLPGWMAVAVWACAPLAAWQAWRLWRGGWAVPAQWNNLAFGNVALVIGAAAAQLAALLALLQVRA